jgi:hypothetical protein
MRIKWLPYIDYNTLFWRQQFPNILRSNHLILRQWESSLCKVRLPHTYNITTLLGRASYPNYLLDGQQGLATTTILLGVIRDIARARGGQLGSDLARDIHRDLCFCKSQPFYSGGYIVLYQKAG